MKSPFSIITHPSTLNHKPLTLLLALTLSVGVSAQIPAGYYDSAEGKTGNSLKVALHNIIKGHTTISYDGLKTAYLKTDADADGKLIDIYSTYRFPPSKSCGSYKKEGDCWNREHTWPQSWFGSGTPKSDLFHVYPTDGKVNGVRSNYPYAEVSNPTYTSTNKSKLGTSITPGFSGKAFEPADDYKGDIARGFFYMSVRYYSEDSNWDSSEMTNKSVILPWAMTMLLRWSDEDPVSQKEIDRNNIIYKQFQHNRNPFIDHPEYAHMIWDEGWTAGTTYAITCTAAEHGTISTPATAAKGTTVTVTVAPDAGYELATLTAYKTDEPATKVDVGSNGTFVMPDYAVTVSATFQQNTTEYIITLADVAHGTVAATPSTSALSGTTITLTATPDDGYALSHWYVFKTGDINTQVAVADNRFTMPAFDVTVSATFVPDTGSGDYVKVTASPDDWSGDYLIVYEGGSKAFNGALTQLDAPSNTINVTIADNTIAASDAVDAATFTIARATTGYTIRSHSGYYIGQTSNANGLVGDATNELTNTIAYNDGAVDIVGTGGAYLRFNDQSGQERFRYYKSSSYSAQKAIQLYKRTAASEPVAITITYLDNSGQQLGTQTVGEMEPTALSLIPDDKPGYEFAGWTTNADGTGDFYEPDATVTLIADLTLYALWDMLYDVAIAPTEHGTITATPTSATEETTITLTATPDEGYEFLEWSVTDEAGNEIPVSDNQFDMPAGGVTVSATFTLPDSISYVRSKKEEARGTWYDLSGRRVRHTKTSPTIYISRQRKVIVP